MTSEIPERGPLRATDVVKICGLSTEDTLDAALAAGADMVGLVFFAKSPRNVAPERAKILAARARGRAAIVALVVNPEDDALAAMIDVVRPDLLQLHGAETVERVAAIRERTGLPVMKAIGVASAADLDAVPAHAAAGARILLDAKPPKDAALPGGNGRRFDWSILENLDRRIPFMLSGGLDPGTVADAIRHVRPAGVDVSSGVETAPGQKDPDLITAFVAAAREGFASLRGHRP
ncbi:MAG: phosphoribosylanthranilate isomerase [Labrys sp. (in: a-proteobacteria)]|jgi:phosphoribosylanthranilate isomerase